MSRILKFFAPILLIFVTLNTCWGIPEHVVRVFVHDGEDTMTLGSGTLMTSDIVLTNHHVVAKRSNKDIEILFTDWTVAYGRVVKADTTWDLAAIKIPTTRKQPVKIGETPQVMQTVSIWGYGYGVPATGSGIVSNFLAPQPGLPAELMVIRGVRARRGDSGGIIYNAEGEYVGTLFGAAPLSTYCIRGDRALKFLEEFLPKTDSEIKLFKLDLE